MTTSGANQSPYSVESYYSTIDNYHQSIKNTPTPSQTTTNYHQTKDE